MARDLKSLWLLSAHRKSKIEKAHLQEIHLKYCWRKTLEKEKTWKVHGLLRQQERRSGTFPTPNPAVRNLTPKSFLTFWCPNSFSTVPSFFVLLWSLWAAMAGLGSLQSMERRWYQRCRPSWMWADLMLGSKRCTSHPLLAMLSSKWLSSLPSLRKKRKEKKRSVTTNAAKRTISE